MNKQMYAPIINVDEVEDFVLRRIHQEFPDFAVSKLLVEMVLEFEKEYLEIERMALPMSFVYMYDDGSLFGVENEMLEYDYEPASINDLIRQQWCEQGDLGRIFVVAEGQYLYEEGKLRALWVPDWRTGIARKNAG